MLIKARSMSLRQHLPCFETSSVTGGHSWGPLALWVHQVSSDCFGLVLTIARIDVKRQTRVWLSLGCKIMSGETEVGFPGCWLSSVYSSGFKVNTWQYSWAGSLDGHCWAYVSGTAYADLAACRSHQGEMLRNEWAASISHTYLIPDLYYTHGVNLRILPRLKK